MKIGITGVTGTFGRAFLQRLLVTKLAERIIGLSRDEFKQAELASELNYPDPLRLFLGDVRDEPRLKDAFRGLDVVVSAAALKRVDATSYNPEELIKTNVLGTINVVRAAAACGVGRVVVLTSDKCCRPTNAYGASKFLAELYSVHVNAVTWPQGTRVSAVRYGNVLGSRGSVLGVFQRAAQERHPLPVTDPRMTRFWLTIGDAVDLVLIALNEMRGGEVFVPDLKAMRIVDLAEAVAPGHLTEIIGLRPGGEKLHEQLLVEEEIDRTLRRRRLYLTPALTKAADFFVVTPALHSWTAEPWEGERVPEGFRYTSDVVNQLSVEGMRKMIAAMGDL